MTRFTVVWDPDVESPFIDTWVAGDSQTRALLTAIANWVDENLANDPDQKGQPRHDLAARIVAVPVPNSPARVSITYRVLPDDRQVRVIRLVVRGS
jgi:hypothetical protein